MILEILCLVVIVLLLMLFIGGTDGGPELFSLGCYCVSQVGCLAVTVIFVTTIVFYTWQFLSQ